jgi:hypothetical protein
VFRLRRHGKHRFHRLIGEATKQASAKPAELCARTLAA